MIKKKHIFCFLLLSIFMFSYSSSHFFMHVHEVNGVLIAHSHLGSQQHQHNAADFQTIKSLSNCLIGNNIIPTFLIALYAIKVLRNISRTEHQLYTVLQHFSLRAPPTRVL